MVLPFWYPQHIVVQAFCQKALLPAILFEIWKVQEAAICKSFIQLSKEIRRLWGWHAFCNFVVDPNRGFCYLSIVVFLPLIWQPKQLALLLLEDL